MKESESWSKGQRVKIEKIGECTLWWKFFDKFYQFQVKHDHIIVTGEPSYNNKNALDNALDELKTKFKLKSISHDKARTTI